MNSEIYFHIRTKVMPLMDAAICISLLFFGVWNIRTNGLPTLGYPEIAIGTIGIIRSFFLSHLVLYKHDLEKKLEDIKNHRHD